MTAYYLLFLGVYHTTASDVSFSLYCTWLTFQRWACYVGVVSIVTSFRATSFLRTKVMDSATLNLMNINVFPMSSPSRWGIIEKKIVAAFRGMHVSPYVFPMSSPSRWGIIKNEHFIREDIMFKLVRKQGRKQVTCSEGRRNLKLLFVHII